MQTQDILFLLSDPERSKEVLLDYELFHMNSFFIIDPEHKGYETDKTTDVFRAYQAYNQGKTIVIKNLEKFIDLTEEFGQGIDIHAYLVPPKEDESGDSFDWHTDDRTVWVKMLYGMKIFATRFWANETRMDFFHKVEAGQKFYIGKGTLHKATPYGASCLLSVGLPDSNQEEA